MLTFTELSRQNTGTHPMDSGGTTGRHWQQPLPSNQLLFEVWKGKKFQEVYAKIPLHLFLDSILIIDQKLTSQMRKAEKKLNTRFNYQEAADWLSEKVNMPVKITQYTYNIENDLTQDFQYSVLSNDNDWCYDENALVVLETHNGADARGGFSDAVVCRVREGRELSHLLDPICAVSIISAKTSDGKKLNYEEMRRIDEKWEIGYGSYPFGEFMSQVDKIHHKNNYKGDILNVTLKNGIKVKVCLISVINY